MYFLFVSEGCPTCFIAQKMLSEKDEAGYVKVVEVQFDEETRKYMTYINGEIVGDSPVNKVPTFYNGKEEKIYTGEKAIEEIINASWKT